MNESQPDVYWSYTRRTLYVFAAVVCGTLLMVWASFVPLQNRGLNVLLVLAGACFNATLVAAFLMHLISERKMIYTILIFTAIFAGALLGLTIVAHHDVPHMTTMH